VHKRMRMGPTATHKKCFPQRAVEREMLQLHNRAQISAYSTWGAVCDNGVGWCGLALRGVCRKEGNWQ
jgi:hypothetical protein